MFMNSSLASTGMTLSLQLFLSHLSYACFKTQITEYLLQETVFDPPGRGRDPSSVHPKNHICVLPQNIIVKVNIYVSHTRQELPKRRDYVLSLYSQNLPQRMAHNTFVELN